MSGLITYTTRWSKGDGIRTGASKALERPPLVSVGASMPAKAGKSSKDVVLKKSVESSSDLEKMKWLIQRAKEVSSPHLAQVVGEARQQLGRIPKAC